eukprot:2899323-Rhodomonas_salina.1
MAALGSQPRRSMLPEGKNRDARPTKKLQARLSESGMSGRQAKAAAAVAEVLAERSLWLRFCFPGASATGN